jgi:hypothetical protein
LIRYQYKSQPATFGWVRDEKVGPVEGSPFTEFRRMKASWWW